MSIKYSTTIQFEDWNLYLKPNMTQLLKWLKNDFAALQHLLTPQLILEIVDYFYARMMELLSFKSPQEGRFAPVLSKYEFLSAEKDGPLHKILYAVLSFFAHRERVPNVRALSLAEFRELYLYVFQLLEDQNLIDRNSFYLMDLPEAYAQQLTQMILQLRGELVQIPEDASIIIRPQTHFVPQFSEDFLQLKRGQSIYFCDTLRTNRYFLRLAERIVDRKEVLVHARCVPADYDYIMNIKDFLAVRQRQINNNIREVDDFPDAVFWQNIPFQALILPPRFVEDSYFFNQYLMPYDYLNSVQESEIDRIQAKFTRKKNDEFSINYEVGEIQYLVYQWNCKQRQAENKPANRHQVSRSVFRGFETYNQVGGILNNNEIVGGNKEEIRKIYYFTQQANVDIQQMIKYQNFIDYHGELHSHIALTGAQGVLFAGLPFTYGQTGAYSDVSRRGKKDENLITFYIRYFSKLDFSIVCNVNDALAVLKNQPIPFTLFEEKEDYQYAQKLQYQMQKNAFVDYFFADVYQAPSVQSERRRLLYHDPAWFSAHALSELEKQLFKDFDQEQLLATRNLIICSWRALPHIYLRLSNIASFVRLPFSKLQRLFQFLEAEKLINDRRVVMACTIPDLQFMHNASLLKMSFKCGKCGASSAELCYFFYQTLQPNEHQPQVLCASCYEKQSYQIQAKYILLRPLEIDRHKAFIITDAFRKSAVFGWQTALKMAAEAGEIPIRKVFDFLVAFKEGERAGVNQSELAAQVWQEEAATAFAAAGVYFSSASRAVKEVAVANAIVNGKREFCRALQELEAYAQYLDTIVY